MTLLPHRCLIVLLLTVMPAHAAEIFINELHYDNAGTDVGERYEIAGPAGTDLSGWSVVLYNGATGDSYSTEALSGVISDQQNGIGTLGFSSSGIIQNGSPDGIALVDATNTVVQFLSYEGAFMANNGPAAGITSTDIGVSEAPSTTAGFSVQLVGSGRESSDFTWAGANPNTFGSLNNVFPNDLIFSEYVEGSGNNKALEIFNGTGSAIDLSNYQIEIFFNGNPSAGQQISLAGSVGSNDTLVIANSSADASLRALADLLSGQVLFNGNDAVGLRNIGSNLLIDVFGDIGDDPGSEWNPGGVGTQNETLRRNSDVYFGDSIPSNFFDPSAEWQSFALNDFSGLGQHAFNPTLPTQTILPAATVPVPTTLLLFLIGLACIGWKQFDIPARTVSCLNTLSAVT